MPSYFDDLCLVEPTPMARRLLWHVLSIGNVWRDEPEVHAGRDKPGAFLFWVPSGTGTLEVGRNRWTLSPGPRWWLLDLRIARSYIPQAGEKLVTSGIRFAGTLLEAWQEALGDQEEFPFERVADCTLMQREQDRIFTLVTKQPAGFEWDVHESLTRILGRLLSRRRVLDQAPDPLPEPVTRVINAVLAEPSRNWRAAELATIARVSYSGLRALFRDSQGESISSFLQRTRLHNVRMLLANEELSIKQVAARAEFSSEFYFSQWFRRHTGLSPTQFRKNIRH
jgi:AraC-like DNA-binding protein